MSYLKPSEMTAMQGVLNTSMSFYCTTQRPGPATTNPHGQPVPGPMVDYLVRLPCSYFAISQKKAGEMLTADREFVSDLYRVLVPYGTDIKVTDRLGQIFDLLGNVVSPDIQYYDIKEISYELTHIALIVKAVR